MNITPKSEKLDLGILRHLEQLLGLELGWGISAYPTTLNIAPKSEKLDLGILQHLEQLFRVDVRNEIDVFLRSSN